MSAQRTKGGHWILRPGMGLLLIAVSALVAGAGVEIATFFAPVIPNEAEWAGSGHADATAEAFIHWDGDGEVSKSCAKCHSTTGHLDFLGVDGTEAGVVDNAAPLGTTVECIACHNEVNAHKDNVVFPSGAEVGDLGPSARCMECHQGRSSGPTVEQMIVDANLPNDDTISSLRFQNIHYFAAAATLLGGEAMGGYQYAGKSYDVRLAHVEGINKCIDCHDPHSLEVRVDKCATCHEGVVTVADLQGVRSMGSLMDYDGDGNVVEGIASEIDGLRDILYGAMQAYGTAMGAPIAYDGHAYPYFFADTNGNGVVDEGDGGYSSFTARMLKAAYNYQVSVKDPGAFAHNGKYLIQLLYDTIEDLDPALVVGLTRDDAGHFNGSAEAFRHWDGDGTVPGSCSKCHSPTGLPFYLAEGVTVSQTVGNGLTCTTCHSSLIDFARREVATVAFPSGAVLDTGDPDSNLCISCHQGRESTVSVDAAIAGLDLDTPSAALRFINVHYFAAGATRFGTEAMGAYEYMGQTYKGLFTHTSSRDTCTECHDAHMGEVLVQSCIKCHKNIQTTADIRRSSTDYDGDGNVAEGIAGEIETMQAFLLAAIQNYAATVAGTPIMYDANRYPYFMTETGGTYKAFTPRLLQATYNYQYSVKDPGAFAHNANYVLQTLYDSAADLGADMSGKIRP